MRLPTGTSHRRHWRDNEPFLLTDVYVDERLRDRISREDVETKTALSLVHDLEGVDRRCPADADGRHGRHGDGGVALHTLNAPVAHVHRRAVKIGHRHPDWQGTDVGKFVRLDIKLR